MKLIEIYANLKKDIDYIENELDARARTDHSLLNDTSLHLLKAGGKRIRPVFVLLSAQFGTYDLNEVKHVAVPLELIHMATLVHDDVIDDAETRRGELTVKTKWDSRIAMYTGDYLLAKALSMASELRTPEIHRILSNAMVRMCIGEMEQIRDFYNVDQSVRHYLLRIRRKTALLIAVSCQLGALSAQAPKDAVRRLYAFGYNVGMAFQITDDVLDLCGTEQQIGKPPGSDILQGNITLPVIYTLEDEALRNPLLREMEQIRQLQEKADMREFLQLVRGGKGVQRAEDLARRYIDKAVTALDGLPDQKAKRHLREIARFIAQRKY